MNRTALVLAAFFWLLAPAAIAAPGVSATEIVVGHDVDLSGPIAVRMKPLVEAADAYFARVNAAGGVHGRRIRILRTDSGNKPDRTKENVRRLVEKDGVFVMWGISGTGNVAAALPYLEERAVPLIGSTSGADSFYAKTHPMLFNFKAGYGDEIRRMAAHLKDTYVRKIAVLYMDNGFGREALKSAQSAAAANGLEMLAVAAFREDGSDIAQAVATVAKSDPPAVMLLTLSGPAPKVVEEYRRTGQSAQLMALSIIATDALYRAVGDRAKGIIVTQIVPFPTDPGLGIVREYREALTAKGVKEYSHAGLEGFILARGLVEGLRAAGKNLTREGLVRALEGIRDKDLGGYKLAFGPTDHNGADFIEITLVGRQGKLIR